MTIATQVNALDWDDTMSILNEHGYTCIPDLLTREICTQIVDLYDDPQTRFRSHIHMARYNFGRGEYKYFGYPLPDIITQIRFAFYPYLATIANKWARYLDTGEHWPETLDELLDGCHQAGQLRPTPLLLRYGAGDFNCLHQDLYGEIHFPLQLIIQLSDPNDFDGGELVLVEQRPRMQSRPAVVPLNQGSAVIIPVRDRPVKGVRGWRRNQMRHGVSVVTKGQRHTLGVIFHDAK